MKIWRQWIRQRRAKRVTRNVSRKLGSEFLEARQLLAGDVLQASAVSVDDGSAAMIARQPRAALSLDARADLSFEADTNERRIVTTSSELGQPAIATFSDGGYVVVRQQVLGSNGWEIFAQRYNANNSLNGGLIRVNQVRDGHQMNPQVAADPNGSFTVVFQSQVSGQGFEVMSREFDSNGVATRTREFAVNSNPSGDQVNPSVTYTGVGQYVVAWNGQGDGVGADNAGIFAQRVAFNDPVGLPIRVNFEKVGIQSQPVVESTGDSQFVIAYQGNGEGDSSGIYMRRFTIDGSDVSRTREIRVNSSTAGADEWPAIAVNPNDDSFVVAWQHHNGRAEGWNIRAQSFNSDLQPVGDLVDVNASATHQQLYPDVTYIDDEYVVTWEGNLAADDASGMGIFARRFTADGTAIGDDVLINHRFTAGNQRTPAVTTDGDQVVFVWEGPVDAGRHGIFRRGFREADLSEGPVLAPLPDIDINPNTQTSFDLTLAATDPDDDDSSLITRVFARNCAEFINDELVIVCGPNAVQASAFSAPVVVPNPDDNMMYSITPATGFTGRVSVAVTVNDGVNEIVRDNFVIIINSNTPPVIAPIADVVLSASQERLEIDYDITDTEGTPSVARIFQVQSNGETEPRDPTPAEALMVRRAEVGDKTQLIVTPVPGFVGEIFITLIAFDGVTRRVTEDIKVTVSAEPSLELMVSEVQAAVVVGPGNGAQFVGIDDAIVADNDNTTMTGATIEFVGSTAQASETLSIIDLDSDNITQSYASGVLTLSGVDTLANYERAIESLSYENTSVAATGTRTLSVVVNDGAQDSASQNVTFRLTSAPSNSALDLVQLAQRLADGGLSLVGAHWDQGTADALAAFEDGGQELNFVEVTGPDQALNEIGVAKSVSLDELPFWELEDGTRIPTDVSFAQLAGLTDQTIPTVTGNSAPIVFEIEDQELTIGAPLLLPLNGFDVQGDDLVFLVSSSNPDMDSTSGVTSTTFFDNRSARFDINGYGEMIFELFEQRAPLAAQRVIDLANSTRFVTEGEGDDATEVEIPFYQDILFHRVINDFVIQAGDPNGDGTGGSELGPFDDQFDVDLQHVVSGLLSMAKSQDDTNNSQFFVTEGASRHLDFNHTIFGLLTEGEAVRAAISDTEIGAGDVPTNPVTIASVEIFEDNENATLMLKATDGSVAGDVLTITVMANDGQSTSQPVTFDVTLVADTFNGGTFLVDFENEIEIPPSREDNPSTFEIDLDGVDVEGDPLFFDLGSLADTFGEVEIDNATGELTFTAAEDFVGTAVFLVGVRPEGTSDTADRFDSQEVIVKIGETGRVFDVVRQGAFEDRDLLGIRTDQVDGAPEITREHVETAVDYSAHSNPPTYGDHHNQQFGAEGVSITPRPTGVYTTAQADEDLIHNLEHGHVWISYNPDMISDADKTRLEEFVTDGGMNAGVILTPRPGNDDTIAVASWAHLLTLGSFDDQMIRDFVNTNRGHAPEGYIPSGEKPEGREDFDDGLPHGP